MSSERHGLTAASSGSNGRCGRDLVTQCSCICTRDTVDFHPDAGGTPCAPEAPATTDRVSNSSPSSDAMIESETTSRRSPVVAARGDCPGRGASPLSENPVPAVGRDQGTELERRLRRPGLKNERMIERRSLCLNSQILRSPPANPQRHERALEPGCVRCYRRCLRRSVLGYRLHVRTPGGAGGGGEADLKLLHISAS